MVGGFREIIGIELCGTEGTEKAILGSNNKQSITNYYRVIWHDVHANRNEFFDLETPFQKNSGDEGNDCATKRECYLKTQIKWQENYQGKIFNLYAAYVDLNSHVEPTLRKDKKQTLYIGKKDKHAKPGKDRDYIPYLLDRFTNGHDELYPKAGKLKPKKNQLLPVVALYTKLKIFLGEYQAFAINSNGEVIEKGFSKSQIHNIETGLIYSYADTLDHNDQQTMTMGSAKNSLILNCGSPPPDIKSLQVKGFKLGDLLNPIDTSGNTDN